MAEPLDISDSSLGGDQCRRLGRILRTKGFGDAGPLSGDPGPEPPVRERCAFTSAGMVAGSVLTALIKESRTHADRNRALIRLLTAIPDGEPVRKSHAMGPRKSGLSSNSRKAEALSWSPVASKFRSAWAVITR
jgi:hypothetical protein